VSTAGLYQLLTWLSPAMPVGAYSYSHGLEYAIEAGLVHDASSLRGYLDSALRDGTGRLDAGFLCAAWQAHQTGADATWPLEHILITAAAMRGTSELALESAAQGRALLTVLRASWPAPALDDLAGECARLRLEPPHAVVLGVACAAHGIALPAALMAFLHGFGANLISAGIRLIPLGQTDGQRLTAALAPAVHEIATQVLATPLDEIGTATPMIDLCSMAHESQHTRLFRS
jgi:urease accessory protein